MHTNQFSAKQYRIGVCIDKIEMCLYSSTDGIIRLLPYNPYAKVNDTSTTVNGNYKPNWNRNSRHKLKNEDREVYLLSKEERYRYYRYDPEGVFTCHGCKKTRKISKYLGGKYKNNINGSEKFCYFCMGISCPGKHRPVKMCQIAPNNPFFYCIICNKMKDGYYPIYGCQICNFKVCNNCVKLYTPSERQISSITMDPLQFTQYGFKHVKNGSNIKIAKEEKNGFYFTFFEMNDQSQAQTQKPSVHVSAHGEKMGDKSSGGAGDRKRCCCSSLFITKILMVFKVLMALSPIFDIGSDIWALIIYISEGSDFIPYALTSIIILYLSNRIYFLS